MLEIPWKRVDFSAGDRMPAFVVNEFLWICITASCLIHACTRKSEQSRAKHLILFITAILGGVANDIIFMYLPLVDNFWHAQATFMLTARFPLYILGVYCGILYIPTAFVWQLHLRHRCVPPVTALLAILFYAPFDIMGAKFLWWTWHDSDNNTMPRFIGVPVSSSMWITVFTFCFSYLLNTSLPTTSMTPLSASSAKRILLCIGVVCLCAVPVMMIHMMIVQIVVGQALPPYLPPPNYSMMVVVLVLYILEILDLGHMGSPPPTAFNDGPRFSRLLQLTILSYLGTLCWIGVHFNPAEEKSLSVHQTYGPGNITATDWSGLSRNVYLSKENMRHSNYFTFDGDVDDFSSWYAIVGIPKDMYWELKMLTVVMTSIGVFVLLPIICRSRC